MVTATFITKPRGAAGMVIICQKRQPLEKTRAYGSFRGVEATEPSQWGDNACALAAWPPG